MKDLSKRLEGIEAKLRQLIQENEALSHKNNSLVEKNELLTRKLALQNDQIAGMEGNLQGVSENTPVTDGKEISISSKQLKQKIDAYTQEIDKAIEWLYNN